MVSSFDNKDLSHYNGGGAVVIEMIASCLAGQYDVTILTAGRRGSSRVSNGICLKKLPVAWAGPRAGQLLYHLLLPIAARRIAHDVWVESFTPPFSTGFLPFFSPRRVVGLAQAFSGREMSLKYKVPFHLVERFGLRFYKDIVVLNEADGDFVRSSSPTTKVHAIPNGIDVADAHPTAFGRGSHILFMGRIDVWQKGIDLLLKAYEQSGVRLPLVIAGAGTPREERKLQDLISAQRGDIRWIGRIDGQEKQRILAESAFVVMPSRHEAFGLVALEAMAQGKPVLHFDLATLDWMKGDVAVKSFDVEALGVQMRELASDEMCRRRLGSTAYTAARYRSLETTANRYLALVETLLQ